MSMQSNGAVDVADAPENSRFEITVDGKLAGFAQYRLSEQRMVFMHTEVDDEYQGQGIAGQLARAALDAARQRSLYVTPKCDYIAGYIRKHPEYAELVDEQDRSLIE